MARLEALTRRIKRSGSPKAEAEPEQLVSGPFVLDEKSRVLSTKRAPPIDLTQVEFQIMELFFRNPATALVRGKDPGRRLGQELLRRRQDRPM